MSSKVQQLLTLAGHFEKMAVDIPQPLGFEDDFAKWKEMSNPKPENDEDAYGKWLEDNSTEEPAPEMSDEERSKKWLEEHRKNLLETKPGDDIPMELLEEEIPVEQKADTYIRTASDFEILAAKLLSNAAEDKKKLDPKAKVRNRGTVCVPASSAKDKKDHFPINSEAQARNALARVHQYSSVPSWYSGSLKSLQELVSRKVHSKYKGIGKDKSSKKASVEVNERILTKYGQSFLAL